jgi:hypothetical protein
MITAAAFALLASSCQPDLTVTNAAVTWDDVQQSVTFTIENNSSTAVSAFDMEAILVENPASMPQMVHMEAISGLGAGEKLEFKNLDLRYLADLGNECLDKVTEVILSVDARNVIVESNEGNNGQVLNVPAIHVPCGNMVRFEDLALNAQYPPGNTFVSDGVTFIVSNLPNSGNQAVVEDKEAFGNGQYMFLNNVWLQPNPPVVKPIEYMAFNVKAAGGEVYLEINGDSGPSPFTKVAAIDGIIMGGVEVEVSGNAENPGVWYLRGQILTLKIGGQEVMIDNMLFWSPQTETL